MCENETTLIYRYVNVFEIKSVMRYDGMRNMGYIETNGVEWKNVRVDKMQNRLKFLQRSREKIHLIRLHYFILLDYLLNCVKSIERSFSHWQVCPPKKANHCFRLETKMKRSKCKLSRFLDVARVIAYFITKLYHQISRKIVCVRVRSETRTNGMKSRKISLSRMILFAVSLILRYGLPAFVASRIRVGTSFWRQRSRKTGSRPAGPIMCSCTGIPVYLQRA